MITFFNADFTFTRVHILELSSRCMDLPKKLIQCKTKLGISHCNNKLVKCTKIVQKLYNAPGPCGPIIGTKCTHHYSNLFLFRSSKWKGTNN